MGGDGAHEGITPERALKTILGGEPPPEDDEKRKRVEYEWRVKVATSDIKTYDDACLYTAKLILEYWAVSEERETIPAETVYDTPPDFWETFDGTQVPPVKELGLYERMKQDGIDLASLGLSGFQWGWAVNAARFIKGLPPEPNPAIVTIGE